MGYLNPAGQGASSEAQRTTVGNPELTSRVERSRRSRRENRARTRIRVLLLEDNPADAALVREHLLALPECYFEVTCAARLDTGLAALGTGAFDALVTDLTLPDATPWQTLGEIQGRTASVAVLVLSGGDDPSLHREALHIGAQAFLGKGDLALSALGRHLLAAVDRHRAQGTQRQIERWISSSPDAVIVTGERGQVKFVNDRALELFGRSKQELLRERFRFSSKAGEASEIQILRGAEQLSAELSIVPVAWQGAPALVASFRDDSERRKAEALLAAADRLASLGALVTSVAHDINNPLAAMIFNLELAAQEALARPGLEELRQLIADAREAAGHVRTVIRDLRIFARAPEEQETASVRRVIDTTLRMTNNQTRHRARLVIALDDVPEVRANESRLGQVLLNLLVNAAQAIPEGAAADNCISVSARRREDWVEIAVSDTGCGMAPALQNRLFTPFFTSKPADQGTGLGLSICQRIVESYGGKMEVESRVGVGSTFRVLLPAQLETATLRLVPPIVARRSHRRGRILVIDDDVLVGTALARAMAAEHAVQVVRSGRDGLATLRVDPNFDVILCDVMMPEMTGTELFERMAREMPELAKRVVFFTGGAFTPGTRELLASLPNRKLDKPIDIEVLSSLIAELVDSRT